MSIFNNRDVDVEVLKIEILAMTLEYKAEYQD